MSKVLVNWLDACECCGHQEVIVQTDGNEAELYDGDEVMCLKCSMEGFICADDGLAFVIWVDE